MVFTWIREGNIEFHDIFKCKKVKNMLKISIIFSKTHDFQTHLNPSNRVQNRFGVVEKIAIECFDPNPENQKKS